MSILNKPMKFATISAGLFLIVGCAANPKLALNYYLAKTDINIKITRTAMCNTQNNIFVASSAEIKPIHSADLSSPKHFNLHDLNGRFANTDLTTTFYEDGRLKGINSTSTGQGQAIITSGIKLASGLLGGVGIVPLELDPQFPDICTYINGGDTVKRDKTLSLTYEVTLNDKSLTAAVVKPNWESNAAHIKLQPAIGVVGYAFGDDQSPINPVTEPSNSNLDMVKISMRQPAISSVAIIASKDENLTDVIFNGVVPIAHRGSNYSLPVAKSALFGTQRFSLEVAESGAVVKIGYGADTGITQVLGAADGALSSFSGQTTAEKAAEAKAEADLIAQQQRVVRCRAEPASCT